MPIWSGLKPVGTKEIGPANRSWTSLKRSAGLQPGQALEANRDEPLDGFLAGFTSGTSGSPKGVAHLHE